MGGHNPQSKIVACLCAGMHDAVDNGFKYGNAVTLDGEGRGVYRLWEVTIEPPGKTLIERVVGEGGRSEAIISAPHKEPPHAVLPPAPLSDHPPGDLPVTREPHGLLKGKALPTPEDATYGPTSLTLREGLSWERWVEIGNTLQQMEKSVNWWVGDWLQYGERTYGEKYTQAVEATGMKAQTLMNYAWVASKVNLCVRRDSLSWSHHKEVASLPEPKQAQWLDTAEAEHLGSDELGWRVRGKPHIGQATGENEWFSPPEYTEAARAVMGGIDLDPASCEAANRTVQADRFYTIEDDGLTQLWAGRVWMNPPYSQPLIGKFTDKLVENIEAGSVEQACVLVNNATETGWFQPMLEVCSSICLMRGRVKFLDATGQDTGAPLQGQAVLYFGNNVSRFREVFSTFGVILRRAE